MNYKISALPIFIFIGILYFLYNGLYEDPTVIPSPLIGKTLPVFESTSLISNKLLTNKDFLGKSYLLNIWASWCYGCSLEHDNLLDIYNNDKILIYGLNYKDDKKSALDWIKMLENNELNNEQTKQHLFEIFILKNILGFEQIELPREENEIDYTMNYPGFKRSICMEVKGTKTENLFKTQTKTDKTRENPVIQVYTYMSYGFDYGVVTNYNKFILITKNTQLVKAHRFNFLSIQEAISCKVSLFKVIIPSLLK